MAFSWDKCAISKSVRRKACTVFSVLLLILASNGTVSGQSTPRDPGVRGGTVDAGKPLGSVANTPGLQDFFTNAAARFLDVEDVQGGQNNGLGPRFNGNQCSSCHSQPAVGGTSPSVNFFPFIGPNPETLVFNLKGAQNTLPPFITPDGPIREAHFKFFLDEGRLTNVPDGGVHDLFVITGRSDAGTCSIRQPNFLHNLALNNVALRIPTALFGAGLIENIPDEVIEANRNTNLHIKNALGIAGRPNRNGNDHTISRFGWKAQNKSLELFAAEAYNVEEGITNEVFPTEHADPGEAEEGGFPANCRFNPLPEDTINFNGAVGPAIASDIVQFAMFMRLLAAPTPSTTTPGGAASIANGRKTWEAIGCAMCHTPALQTGPSAFTADLNNVSVPLFSDMLLHHMGTNLADGISQGTAGPDEFRTQPLWGVGQRIFLLHDGRTTDLLDAIHQHESHGSEANAVIRNFRNLSPQQEQDILNFLRSL